MTPRVYRDEHGHPYPATRLDDRDADGAAMAAAAYAELRGHAERGGRLLEAGDFGGAFHAFRAGIAVIPDPLERWNASGWLLVAMAEAAFRAGDFRAALPPLRDGLWCPGTLGNPWVHLRLGQIRLELGDHARALDDLTRAYRAAGRDIFADHDPKYFAALERALAPPPEA